MTSSFYTSSADAETVCPATGLVVHSRPEWTDCRFGSAYRLTTRVIGDRILLNQPSGFAEMSGIVDSLRMTDGIVDDAIDATRGYVHISDYSGMRGITREARKHYIRHMERREAMLGLIYFNVSPLFRIMIKLAKRLSIVKFNVLIVRDYPAAMAAALRLIGVAPASPRSAEAPPPTKTSAITEHAENGRRILRCDDWHVDREGYRLTASRANAAVDDDLARDDVGLAKGRAAIL